LKNLIFALFLLLFSFSNFAQTDQDGDPLFSETTKDLVIVTAWASTGALLGLSTLSFVDEPWDHSKNILVGFSIGTVIGVAFVAYYHANRSEQYYEEVDPDKSAAFVPSKDFNTGSRVKWHYDNFNTYQSLRPDTIPLWRGSF
jgi:hypothetical protein